MGMIKESFLLAATDVDVLAAPSRLAAIPSAGTLTLELSSTHCDTTNRALVTIQLPDGTIPTEALIIPYDGAGGSASTMDDLKSLQLQFGVNAGGHVLVAIEEVGAVSGIFIIATLTF